MRFLQLFFLVGLLAFAASCNSQVKQEKVDFKSAVLVDVRTPAEFAEGTAPGAINIPLQEMDHRMEELKGKRQIVVFCRSGNRSAQAKRILEQNGFSNVTNGGTWEQVSEMVLAKK